MKQVPIIKNTDLFIMTDYYKWLVTKLDKGEKCDSFLDTVKEYTNHIPSPFKGRFDGQSHKYVFETFWNLNVKPNKVLANFAHLNIV